MESRSRGIAAEARDWLDWASCKATGLREQRLPEAREVYGHPREESQFERALEWFDLVMAGMVTGDSWAGEAYFKMRMRRRRVVSQMNTQIESTCQDDHERQKGITLRKLNEQNTGNEAIGQPR